jgi:hypothetical protein
MTRKKWLFSLAGMAALSGQAISQVPLPPAAQFAGAGLPGIAPGPAAPTPPRTLWGFLGLGKEQKEFCLRKLCAKPIGQLINNGFAPLSTLSGGLISGFCPKTPSIADLADAGAVGAASAIQLDEAGAAKRRAAVRYLGTVDCHYWPEAEDALIGALRGDRNECVRYEAALALGSGCCCTKKTIEALTIVVSCSDRDGAPKETSYRVHAAAQAALDHCLACFNPPTAPAPAPVPTPEGGATPETKSQEKLPPPATIPPITPTSAKQSDEKFELGEAKPFTPPDAKKPGDQGVVFAAGTSTKKPAPDRPVGFAYYAKITQVGWAPLLAEARKTAANPKIIVPPSDKSLASLIAQASSDMPGEPAMPKPRPANLLDKLRGPAPFGSSQKVTATQPTVAAFPMTSPAPAPSPVKLNPAEGPRELPVTTIQPMAAPTASPRSIKQASKSAATTEPVTESVEMPKIEVRPTPKPEPAPELPKIEFAKPTEKPAPIQLPVIQNGVILPPPAPAPDHIPVPEPIIIHSKPKAEPAKEAVLPTIKVEDKKPAKPEAKPTAMPTKPAAPKVEPKRAAPAPAKPIVIEKPAEPKPAATPAPIIMVKPAAESKAKMSTPPMPLPLSDAHAMPTPVVTPVQPKMDSPLSVAVTTADSHVAKLLAEARSGANVDERRNAIKELVKARTNTPEVIQTLEQLSNDPMPGVRAESVIGLARLRTPATFTQPARAVARPSSIVPANLPALPQAPTGIGTPTLRASTALSKFSTGCSAAERCQAAAELDAADLQSSPGLVHMLIAGARSGQSTEERQACIKALVRGKAAYAEVVTALDEISNDPMPAIRADATIGVARLRVPGR